MTYHFTYRSLSSWPGTPTPERDQRVSPFRAPLRSTQTLLDQELRQLHVTGPVVLEAYYSQSQIRLDGLPYARAEPSRAGIILSFTSGQGSPLRFPCDTYQLNEDNLRAIALTLEKLRTIDRYGVTRHAEQYKGWEALPPSADEQDPLKVLEVYWGNPVSPTEAERVYRQLMERYHPDKNPGGATTASTINAAMSRYRKGASTK